MSNKTDLDLLIDTLTSIREEFGSHPKLEGRLNFVVERPEGEDLYFELSRVDVDTTIGCGCWIGADIILKEDKL
jgi:hypothetical protein